MDITGILTWLNAPALTWQENSLSNAEVFGFATGLLCVWLTVWKNIWNFPIGILNCALLFFLFWEGRLFADASLQILFIALGLHGWWQWTHGRINHVVTVSSLSTKELLTTLISTVALTGTLFVILTMAKGSIPIFDGLITALSLVAQYLLNQRKIESWFFWIAVDVISIPVYAYKGLYLIAILYGIFLVLCVLGYREWRRTTTETPVVADSPELVL
jgi:nicotinamide mononucleotide transporter